MGSLSDSILNIDKRVFRNSIDANSYNTTVDRIKIFFEYLSASDSFGTNIPLQRFEEWMGICPFFRFDYGRFNYDKFSDIGGVDNIEYYEFTLTETAWKIPQTINGSELDNPDNMKIDDESYASLTVGPPSATKLICNTASNIGFTLPAGAIIAGIITGVIANQSGTVRPLNEVKLYSDVTQMGDAKSSASSPPDVGFGEVLVGTSSDNWNANLTYDVVNNSNFGIKITASFAAPKSSSTLYVDYITMKIYYYVKGDVINV